MPSRFPRGSQQAGVSKRGSCQWFSVTHKSRYIGGDVDSHKAIAKKAEVAGQSLTVGNRSIGKRTHTRHNRATDAVW